jgi:flagellar basal-body rod modification protein FlgD
MTSVSSVTGASATPPSDMISSSDEMTQMDFLQMLTAQMRSQDPMNPMDGQEFASQLAQFSSLQELQSMGTTMGQTLQANLLLAQSFNNTMAAGFIGKTVRAEMDQMTLDSSGGATLCYNLSDAATEIDVEIKDSDGDVVRTLHVNPQAAGEHSLTWDGLNSDGGRASAGDYTYSVKATDADGNDVTATTFLEGVVASVNYESGSAVLMVNGMSVSLSQVMSISDTDTDGNKRRG